MNNSPVTSKKSTAFLETILVCSIFIVLSNIAVAKDIFGATQWFTGFSQVKSNIAGGFTTGAITQLLLVITLIGLPFFPDARKAISTLRLPAAKNGWRIALIILLIEVVVLYLGWIKDINKLFDTSTFGLSMSFVPALDGLTQETIFRGYVVLRLARSGVSRSWQIVLSGILFAAIHINYISFAEEGLIPVLSGFFFPIAGTFSLGAAWAFAFQQSEYKLLPVVVSHVLVIALVQPWLAYSYAIS